MGHVQIIRDFPSPPEGSARTIRIYTPDAYEQDPNRQFPVLYMHDGQNVFAHPESARFETWCANTALEQLVREQRIVPWIIVGVDHREQRLNDYSPWNENRGHHAHPGWGESYARFLVENLRPFVEQNYRVRTGPQWTGTMGSSLGGLISLYLGMSRPDVFGRIGALSPTVMWAQSEIFRRWERHTQRWTRIYLDAGADEYIEVDGVPLDYGRGTRAFYEHLRHLGYADWEVKLVLEPGGQHHEKDWQRRLPGAMSWLLS
ncbi:MAG: alpha/beta hydrolase-fold protein [Myxococcota bacterium]